jgi:cleavage and polyadenylation specificity factor subunit 1
MINYYHRFIKGLAGIIVPLNEFLKGNPPRSQLIKWTETAISAFEDVKEATTNATLLVHPDPSKNLQLVTDASDWAIGAALQEVDGDSVRPLAFFSRKLSEVEAKRSTFDRELLAIFVAIRHFNHFLEGRNFHILTDHKPLVHAFRSKTFRTNTQERQLLFISEYSTDIRHISGKENEVADALSRIEVMEIKNDLLQEIASQQKEDPEIEQLKVSNGTAKWAVIRLPTTRCFAKLVRVNTDRIFLRFCAG